MGIAGDGVHGLLDGGTVALFAGEEIAGIDGVEHVAPAVGVAGVDDFAGGDIDGVDPDAVFVAAGFEDAIEEFLQGRLPLFGFVGAQGFGEEEGFGESADDFVAVVGEDKDAALGLIGFDVPFVGGEIVGGIRALLASYLGGAFRCFQKEIKFCLR